MNPNSTLKEQFRRNAVALISLAIAITSLGYNTWRNEASEHNRNQRLVSIQLLLMLGEFEQLVRDRHYGIDVDTAGISRKAWAKVLTIRDLSQVASGAVPASAENLFVVWNDNYKLLGKPEQPTEEAAKMAKQVVESVIAALNAVRRDTHDVLQSLD